MQIVIFNWRDIKHPLAGGAEQSLLEHAKYWRKKGASVIWFASDFPKAKKEEYIEGIRIIRRGTHYTVHVEAFFYFKKYLKKSTDIIIDCFHGLPYFSPLYFSREHIIALINEPAKDVWFKNLPFPANVVAYYLEPTFFLFYKKIPFVTSANSIAEELHTFGVKQKKISIIPHGVTIEKVKSQKKAKSPKILYLSQLSPDKGIEDALTAFSLLKDPSARLLVVGKSISKEYFKKLQEMVIKLHIKKRVKFYGFISQREKFSIFYQSWFLIHPSIREGWGLNVIEANSCGIPAIGYNVTGLRDSIVDNKTGMLTKENSPQSLAGAIEVLINNTALRERLGKNALRYASKFTWQKAGEKSWKLIEDTYAKNK